MPFSEALFKKKRKKERMVLTYTASLVNHNDLKVLFAKGSPLNKRVYYSLIFGKGAITILALGFGLLYPHSLRSFGYKAQTRELI